MAVGEYGTFLEARTQKQAEQLASRRGMGETVCGHSQGGHDVPRASKMVKAAMRWPERMECLHAISFLCYMALQAKVVQPYEVLGDQGVLHEAVHQFLYGGRRGPWIKRELERIEGLIPGYPKVRPRRRKRV
jgi:hypothetical protein